MSSALAVGFLIALAGPPLGSLLFVVPVVLRSAVELGLPTVATAVEVLKMTIAVGYFSYAFGGTAALIAAIALAFETYRRGTFTYLRAILTAAIATVASVFGFEILLLQGNDFSPGLLMFLLPSAVFSAVICRYGLARAGHI